jgi:ubiquinone/menaquinone biosynthesis C-methylase UbiE
MSKEKRPYVCPAEFSGSLDNFFRKMVHNPRKILEPYIRKNTTVLDLGCGPGYFTSELARMVGEEGRVIAADLQQAMLEKTIRKIRVTDLEPRVEIHKCLDDKIDLSKKVDFVLAFWMVHEVPDQHHLFGELKSILNPDGRIFIVEPKIHVRERSFNKMIAYAESEGFEIREKPKVFLSRAVILSIRNQILNNQIYEQQ